MVEKKSKKPVFKQWWFWVIIGALVLIGIGGAANKNKTEDKKTEDSTSKTEDKKTETKKTDEDPNVFEETEMEAFCQEDHVNDIKGYFSGHKISIIKMTDYNKFFEAKSGKTKDTGADVALLTWKGHDKTLDKDIDFSCWATKTNGEKKIVYLGADGQTIRGTLDF